MRLLVEIDLSGADLSLFEQYEAAVLPLIPGHGGDLAMRVRSMDDDREIHLVRFPTTQAYEAYRADPRRAEAAPLWARSQATAKVTLVKDAPAMP